MFYGNSDLLEKSLHNDLNTLIKNVKARQDQHLTLLQYNKGLIQQLSEMDSIPFFQEQMAKHRSFLESVKTSETKIKQEEQEIIQKYMCAISGQSSIIKLMGRVTARVMEILQASLQKAKSLDESLTKKYLNLKTELLDLVNNKQKIDIQALIQVIILHIQQKCKNQMQNLQKIINILVQGNFSQLNKVYQPIKKQPPKPPIVHHKTSVSPDKKQIKKKLDKSKQKMDKIRQQAKQIQKNKKKKAKLATRMLTTLYNTMQISKNQFMEDMVFTNQRQKRRQLYEEMIARNKFNKAQIVQFQSKKDQFQVKIQAFKKQMEKQSHKIQQALVFIANKQMQQPVTALLPRKQKQKTEEDYKKQVKSQAAQVPQQQQPPKMPQKQRMFRRRQKKSISKAPSPRLIKQSTYVSMQSTQDNFQHIKFDLKNEQVFSRSNRAKLPQITGRSSLDNHYDQKKKQPQKRINIVKNIDIGGLNPQLKPLLQENGGRKSPKQRLVAQNNNGFQYTFYVKKKTNKFYETKNNFVF